MKSLIILSLLFSFNAFAAAVVDTSEPPIAKGTDIEVDRYDVETDTFEIVIVKEPGVGPNFAASEDLFKATGLTEVKKKKDLVGSVHKLKDSLKLLSEDEAVARKK